MSDKRQCGAKTRKGNPCRSWAVPNSNPPRCASHGGAAKPPGAPKHNQNAVKHGFYATYDAPGVTIDDVIADLSAKYQALSDYLDKLLQKKDIESASLVHLFGLHAQTASRLGRLLRDKKALSGAAADGFTGAIAQALDELNTIWGTEL